VYGVTLLTAPTGAGSTLSLNADGTFTYAPGAGVTSDSFSYCANGTVTGATCSSGITATVTLASCADTAGCLGAAPAASGDSYSSNIASRLQVATPGVLVNDTDPSGLPLKAPRRPMSRAERYAQSGRMFIATLTILPTGAGTATVTFDYQALNSQNTPSPGTAT
jgi:hypothetical protein